MASGMQASDACTRVLWSNSDQGVFVGRTMDWPARSQPELWIFPRGIEHHGAPTGASLNWKSKYGSVGTSAYHNAIVDGLNEKGLAAHTLWLDEADYGSRDLSKPGLALSLWAQYYLDNFASVSEAVKATEAHPFQVLATFYAPMNRWMKLHLVLEDASGDSAIIEEVEGKMHIYHNRANTVVTNSPTYPEQLANLKRYQGVDEAQLLPGSGKSPDRFVRATYYVDRLPKPPTPAEAMVMLRSVMDNVAQPFSTPLEQTPNSPTDWMVIDDLTHGIYRFLPTDTGTQMWIDTNRINFSETQPIKMMDPLNPKAQDNVLRRFVAAEAFTPLSPTEA